ncbi:MAG: transposase [Betaproteobacteria bacterium]|nr:transposase [Betaproteobacteria bacterium]
MRLGDDLLAPAEALAASRGMEPAAPGAALGAARGQATGLLAGGGRQLFHTRGGRGKKSGSNPTDRRRAGSKHHLLTDAQGIPLSIILTGANRHDVTQLLPLVRAVPPIGGKRGAPKRKLALVQADRAYDSDPLRELLAEHGIDTQIARLAPLMAVAWAKSVGSWSAPSRCCCSFSPRCSTGLLPIPSGTGS